MINLSDKVNKKLITNINRYKLKGDKMKVLIFYATYGGGHLSAANAIKEALQNNYEDVEIEMIDCMEYVNKAVNKLTVKAYTDMAKKTPWAWGKVYKHSNKGPISGVTKVSNKLFSIKLKALIRRINPDIIISTHPFSTQMCASLIKHKKINVKLANILTDFQPHDQWLVKHEYVDYFFISNNEMKEKLIEKGIDENKIYVTGIPISGKFSKKYNKEEIIKEFNLKENTKKILFFAGGKYGLAKNNVYEILETLAKENRNLQVIAISGKNEKIFNKFNEIVEKYNAKEKIRVIEFTDKVPEFMSVSDVVITKPRRNNSFRKHGNRNTNNCDKSNTRARRRKCRISRKT